MAELVIADAPRLKRILDDTYSIWHDGLTRAAYGSYYEAQRRTPWGCRHLHRFALIEQDEVLASAKLYDLDGTLDGRRIRIAGLGAVFTSAARRGRGWAAVLVERLLDRAASEGYDAALLFSEIAPAYYERLGFSVMPTEELTMTVAEQRRGAPAVMVRVGDDRDLPAIAEMSAMRAGGYRLHLNRTAESIQFAIVRKRLLAGLGPRGGRRSLFFVVEEGGGAAAYALITDYGAEWVVEECGDRDPAGARIGALLEVLIAREPIEIRPVIRGWLPPRVVPPQIEVVAKAAPREVMMMRPIGTAPLPELGADDILYYRSDYF